MDDRDKMKEISNKQRRMHNCKVMITPQTRVSTCPFYDSVQNPVCVSAYSVFTRIEVGCKRKILSCLIKNFELLPNSRSNMVLGRKPGENICQSWVLETFYVVARQQDTCTLSNSLLVTIGSNIPKTDRWKQTKPIRSIEYCSVKPAGTQHSQEPALFPAKSKL